MISEDVYVKNVERRVYQINDYLKFFKDVMDHIVHTTHHMDAEDLMYDRDKFISMTDKVDFDEDGYQDYDAITLSEAVRITQIIRFGKPITVYDDEMKEQNGHKIDKDFFDEREFDRDEYTKYKKY